MEGPFKTTVSETGKKLPELSTNMPSTVVGPGVGVGGGMGVTGVTIVTVLLTPWQVSPPDKEPVIVAVAVPGVVVLEVRVAEAVAPLAMTSPEGEMEVPVAVVFKVQLTACSDMVLVVAKLAVQADWYPPRKRVEGLQVTDTGQEEMGVGVMGVSWKLIAPR